MKNKSRQAIGCSQCFRFLLFGDRGGYPAGKTTCATCAKRLISGKRGKKTEENG